eukprot:scaffold2906_cov499-Pavlova_lutheri.AAC.1
MAGSLSRRSDGMRAFGTRGCATGGVSRRRTSQLRRGKHAAERVRRGPESVRVPMDGGSVSDGFGWRRSNERGRAGRSMLLLE